MAGWTDIAKIGLDTLERTSNQINPMKVTVGGKPDDQLASISDSQYKYYQNQYVPYQNSLIRKARSPISGLSDEFDTYTDSANRTLAGIDARAMDRYGTARTARQSAATDRLNNLQQAAARSSAKTDLALQDRDMNTAMLGQMAALGRGLSTQSVEGLSSAAANERSRQMQEAQADAAAEQAQQAQQAQLLSAGIGMIPMLAMMSDERLKYDIKPIDNALEKLQKLDGSTWNWIDTDEQDAGVIAQQVEEVMPGLVAKREDGYKAVKYQGLIGLLISAMNELIEKLPGDLTDAEEKD